MTLPEYAAAHLGERLSRLEKGHNRRHIVAMAGHVAVVRVDARHRVGREVDHGRRVHASQVAAERLAVQPPLVQRRAPLLKRVDGRQVGDFEFRRHLGVRDRVDFRETEGGRRRGRRGLGRRCGAEIGCDRGPVDCEREVLFCPRREKHDDEGLALRNGEMQIRRNGCEDTSIRGDEIDSVAEWQQSSAHALLPWYCCEWIAPADPCQCWQWSDRTRQAVSPQRSPRERRAPVRGRGGRAA